jgi:cation transport ATPase
MHCEFCVRRVTAALQAVKGVEVGSVQVGSARTKFDSNQAGAEESLPLSIGSAFPHMLRSEEITFYPADYDELLEMIYKNAR